MAYAGYSFNGLSSPLWIVDGEINCTLDVWGKLWYICTIKSDPRIESMDLRDAPDFREHMHPYFPFLARLPDDWVKVITPDKVWFSFDMEVSRVECI